MHHKVIQLNNDNLKINASLDVEQNKYVIPMHVMKVEEGREWITRVKCMPEYKEKISEIMNNNRQLFDDSPRKANHYEHKIEIYTEKPFIYRGYPIPQAYKEQVKEK